jgi:hypothetical protein
MADSVASSAPVSHLEHGHEAGVHADHVHLTAEEPVRAGDHSLQLLIVEAVASAVVEGNAAIGRRTF